VLFGRVLHGAGLEASPGRVAELLDALSLVGLQRREDVKAAARCLFVRRREELALFDAAFEMFWRRPAEGETTLDLRAMGERRVFRRPRFEPARPLAASPLEAATVASPAQEASPRLLPTWSAREVLRHKDFAALTAAELREVRDLVAGLRLRVCERPSRRRRPGEGGEADLRRTLRRSLRFGGEVLRLETRERKRRPRPVVVLADISGSMERYTRPLLFFMYALTGLRGAEAFTFGTRLTRVTPALRRGDLERSLHEVARVVPDWSGGTRIGEALARFNREWGPRVLSHGAVVLLLSDGWDRGEPEVLRHEMAQLQRRAFRLIWLNPLLGSPEYEPLSRGMQAALPYVDDFLPVHNLASLEELASRLASLEARRPERRRSGRGRAA
jgi:uncharacterized protein with von Willebrand factor type A (vWA) domain